MALTRINGASARASDSVMLCNAALLAVYAIEDPPPSNTLADDTLTTDDARPEARAPSSSSERIASTIWNGPTVLTPNRR